jgi:hypothetical protein
MASISVFLRMYTNNFVHTVFRIWYKAFLLSSLLFSATNMMQNFLCEALLQGIYNSLLIKVSYSSKGCKV